MARDRLTPHQRWLAKVARDTARARLARARRTVREAREQKRTARRRARATCKRARTAFKRWVTGQRVALRERIARLRADLRARIGKRRERLRACCGKDERQRVMAASEARIAAARAELEQLLAELRRERVWSRKDPHSAPIARAERRSERDHEVESELTPDELVVWQRVRRDIRASDRLSRLEAFRHWVHEHAGEVARYLEEDAEAAYKRAVREEQRERAAAGLLKTDRGRRRYVASELAAVPF